MTFLTAPTAKSGASAAILKILGLKATAPIAGLLQAKELIQKSSVYVLVLFPEAVLLSAKLATNQLMVRRPSRSLLSSCW